MKRIVIKVGSGVLTENNTIAKERMLNLVALVAKLQERFEIILVTSGAVASGYTALKLNRKEQISKKVLASLGQPILMSSYKRKFEKHNVTISQILLTEEDFDSRKRTAIFTEIIDTLLTHKILPIVNENDISTTPEQVFGDNDQLSAHVAHYMDADLLVILSDINGYYDKNPSEYPDATILKEVNSISSEALNAEHSPNNAFATGGIVTKLMAAQFLLERGRKMFLCSGYDLSDIESYLLDGVHRRGTLFISASR
ncbi:glutamate 5-kinase [Sulfuricurvum sp.]|uniref:glutamate 5-kinase n=1 Tax=Sulfuricurvum sp. TaxID=2025608 RepID=UPI0026251594|nr:glutamate 5-kinase [Sulfuricurvum sp.]MDD2267095.1 glutamate 5-kinase [Sulfuricurvum sp.]MDD2782738.1 glutamate 5-kinase [Sulfuricurvum sp.]